MSKQKYFKEGNPEPIYGKVADYVHHERKEKASKFLVICPTCGAIEEKKRWSWDPKVKESERKEVNYRLCPGCEAVKNQWIEGEILLKNRMINLIPEQLEELFHNEEEKMRQDNPKSRIVSIKKTKTFWKLYTANIFLARRIAEELEKTFVSKVTYKFSKGNKSVYIVWEEK